MTTPNYGFPFPVLGDTPNVPRDVQALAEAADTALKGLEDTGDGRWGNLFFTQALTGTIADSTISGPETYQVTFSKAFAAAPAVLMTWFEGQYGFSYLASVTAASMVVGVRPAAGSTIPRIRWVALGQAVA